MADKKDIGLSLHVDRLVEMISSELLDKSLNGTIAEAEAKATAREIVAEAVEVLLRVPITELGQNNLISIDGNWTSGHGESKKIANIIVSPSKLMKALAKSGITLVHAFHATGFIKLIFGADLLIELYEIAKIKLNEPEVLVVFTIWNETKQATDEEIAVSKEQILLKSNAELVAHSRQEMSSHDLNLILIKLSNYKCIKSAWNDSQNWYLCEEVETEYER